MVVTSKSLRGLTALALSVFVGVVATFIGGVILPYAYVTLSWGHEPGSGDAFFITGIFALLPRHYRRLAVFTCRSYNVPCSRGTRRSVAPTLRKHGIDFTDAELIFRGFALTAEDTREAYGERRFLTLGLLEDQVSVAHTERGDDIRIISIRKATKYEARFYFSQIVD